MANQTSKKAAAKAPADETAKQDAAGQTQQPETQAAPDTGKAAAAGTAQSGEKNADKRPNKLKADPDLADVAAFVGVPIDQVFAFKVHPDRAVIVTVAGQRVIRALVPDTRV